MFISKFKTHFLLNSRTLDPLQSEWLVKYDGVNEFLTNAVDSFFFVTQSQNKTLLSELVPYAFEAHGASVVLLAVARWMMQGHALDATGIDLIADYGSSEERWIHASGFITEATRILSFTDHVEKLFNTKIFLPLCMFCFDIRPFTMADEEYISRMVSVMLTTNQDLLRHRAKNFADRNIIPFLCSGAEHNFLCEKVDETGHKVSFRNLANNFKTCFLARLLCNRSFRWNGFQSLSDLS